jgi:hypothetical protein
MYLGSRASRRSAIASGLAGAFFDGALGPCARTQQRRISQTTAAGASVLKAMEFACVADTRNPWFIKADLRVRKSW